MFFIYRLTDEVQDYYGQTKIPNRRLMEHKQLSCPCLSRKLDKSKMKMHIIHRLYTQEEADETEAFYQLNFDCVNNNVAGKSSRQYYYEKYKDKPYNNPTEEQKNKYRMWGNIKCDCACGGKYTNCHRKRHTKSKKHQNYIKSIENKK